MASGLQQEASGYENFVSPKRKRMLSPNNFVKSSKDHAATHIPKHREVQPDNVEGLDSRSESPSTNFFLRQPADRKLNFDSLKKGNIFGKDEINRVCSNENDFDGDVDADYNTDRRTAKCGSDLADRLEINKGFSKSRNFVETKSNVADEGTRESESDADPGVESDYSAVAGRMSTLSVGKRRSSLGVPHAKRGSPGSSPASQNSSVNSSLIMSPTHNFAGSHVLMTDFHTTGSPAQFPVPLYNRTRAGGALLDRAHSSPAALPPQSRRSKVNSLISSAILNSGIDNSPALSHNGSVVSAGGGRSAGGANDTYIGPFQQHSTSWANHSDATDHMFNSNASYRSNSHQDSDSFQLHMSGGAGCDYSAHSDLAHQNHSHDHSRSDDHEHKNRSNHLHSDEWEDIVGSDHSVHALPPRTPAVPKHTAAHQPLPPYSASSAGRSLFPCLEEQHQRAHTPVQSAQKRAAVERAPSDDDDFQMGLAYEDSASPMLTPTLTPTKPNRRLQSGSHSQPLSLSQQSHEAGMGDLGSPVSEVGSPAVLDDPLMDDNDPMDEGEDHDQDHDQDHDAEYHGPSRGARGRGAARNRGLLGDSLLGDSDEENGADNAELARLAFPSAHSAAADRRGTRGGRGASPGTPHTAVLKNRLFEEDAGLAEEDHQYHLFAQHFIGSPGNAHYDAHGRVQSPIYHQSKKGHGSSEDMSEPTDDNILDSSADTTAMSTTGASSDILHMSKSSGSNSNSRNTSSCMDIHSDGNNSFGSHGRSNGSIGTLPLPDQSAFDGSGNPDLSRSSYESTSHGHIDAAHFGSPGSARKKRPANASHFPSSPLSPGPMSPNGHNHGARSSCPPTPLCTVQWDAQDALGSPQYGDRAHHHGARYPHGKHQRQGSRSSNDATMDSTPPVKAVGAVGIAVPDSGESTGSSASTGSSSSHGSDILSHNWHNNKFDLSSCESKAPSGRYGSGSADTFSSLADRAPALVRQSSLLDTKMLLTQSEDQSDAPRTIAYHTDFEEVGLLGSGTFADVYKVRQLWGNQSQQNVFYAVKKSKRQFRSKRDRERLMAEVRTMKLLGQQNACAYVVPFIRAWQEDSYFYVQMGYAERGTLKELLTHLAAPSRRGMSSSAISTAVTVGGALVPDNTIWHVVHDVCSGLRHIHRCGMVHLDIKPANLLITEQGSVQIGDFGMAASIGSNDDGQEGDTRYMAEELLNVMERVTSADIFSLGLTLYEIACFFADEPSNQHRHQHQAATSSGEGDSQVLRITPRMGLPTGGPLWHTLREDRAPPLPAHRATALQQLISACMRRNPEARPTAAQVLFLQEVEDCEDDVDPVLLCAPKLSDPPRGTQARPFGRSASMQGMIDGAQRSLQTADRNLGISITVGEDNQIDYASLGDGAFTPNFNHHSYSPH